MIATPDPARRLLICSCEGTMPLDADAIRRGCRCDTTSATQLCGAELDRFRSIASEDGPLTVGCTQQAALFTDVAAEIGRTNAIQFANIRETAGWSSEADHAGPKMAALLAAAAEPMPPTPSIELQSNGVILDLRSRRDRGRGRQPAQGSSRRYRTDRASGFHCAATQHRISGGERQGDRRQRAFWRI